MAFILIIDTSGPQGLVAIARHGECLAATANHQPMQHAAFVQPAVEQLMQQNGWRLADLDAVAVLNGPGSYTGLRVGLASAKGICYALNKPLITLSSLQTMALAAANEGITADKPLLFCPMIDARRMEVFFGMYNGQNEELLKPAAVILDEHFLSDYLSSHQLVFSGDGAAKWQNICPLPAQFITTHLPLQYAAATLAEKAFLQSCFADLAYSEPFYCKEFYSPLPAKK